MTKKIYFSAAALIALGILGVQVYDARTSDSSTHIAKISAQRQISTQQHAVKSQPNEARSDSRHPEKSGSDIEERTHSDVAVVDNWLKRTGFSPIPQKAYEEQYTEKQLIELSENGDMIATDALTSLYISQGRDAKIIVPLLKRGIIQGSFSSISAMATHYNSESLFVASSAEEAKANLKESLAYLTLLDLRGVGKAKANDVTRKVYTSTYNERHPNAESISDADEQYIRERAQQLYDDYQAERQQLGLGDFDNDMPEEARKFFGYL